MVEIEKPRVYYTSRGVPYVRPADILRSAVGQRQIRAMAEADLVNQSRRAPQSGTLAGR